jgi:hypothetical protein
MFYEYLKKRVELMFYFIDLLNGTDSQDQSVHWTLLVLTREGGSFPLQVTLPPDEMDCSFTHSLGPRQRKSTTGP